MFHCGMCFICGMLVGFNREGLLENNNAKLTLVSSLVTNYDQSVINYKSDFPVSGEELTVFTNLVKTWF